MIAILIRWSGQATLEVTFEEQLEVRERESYKAIWQAVLLYGETI